MAGYEANLTEPSTPFGDFELVLAHQGAHGYEGRVALTLGMLAHQLMHGSPRREQDVVNGVPMSISVSPSAFCFPQVHGAVLGPNSIVAVESHSLFQYRDTQGCSPAGCGGARALVVASPMQDFLSRTVKGTVSASAHLVRNEWMLERVTTAAYHGADGYGEKTPLDPREHEVARQILGEMLELGHEFLDPRLHEYAVELAA